MWEGSNSQNHYSVEEVLDRTNAWTAGNPPLAGSGEKKKSVLQVDYVRAKENSCFPLCLRQAYTHLPDPAVKASKAALV